VVSPALRHRIAEMVCQGCLRDREGSPIFVHPRPGVVSDFVEPDEKVKQEWLKLADRIALFLITPGAVGVYERVFLAGVGVRVQARGGDQDWEEEGEELEARLSKRIERVCREFWASADGKDPVSQCE
jgi:hypothetical protein